MHASLQRGLKELGFTRPTQIQADAIPPALEGHDVLACAMTGSGKTIAFVLPILEKLIEKPRGTTRALILTPTRELAAQILESINDVAVHTGITAATVYGGVGMGPQEHAFRSGVDIIIATPGRLLDHFRQPYAKLTGIEHLVFDEADRMLDMGFLPDIRRVIKHLPVKRQTLFFSATMPPPIAQLTREMLKSPVTINVERQSKPAVGITQAVYPVTQELKSALLVALLTKDVMKEALVFTRTKHRANRLADYLVKHGINAERIHGNRSQSARTAALAGFKNGTYRVLVATDIAARGIDVEALGHVVNLDVPAVPEDYIHRVGRTARAELTGDAFTFVAPDEEADLRAIEKAIGKRLPRVTLPDFNYSAKPEGRLEIPIAERIAEIRKRKAEERGRAAEKAKRRGGAPSSGGGRPGSSPARGGGASRAESGRSESSRSTGPQRDAGAPRSGNTSSSAGPSRGVAPHRGSGPSRGARGARGPGGSSSGGSGRGGSGGGRSR
ncbi:MAG: DEAD/DEAH box helicase [Gemmatimonadetes bacterium]|nr:DEAD/DEAH box helicase [Gemmatimonadota bacterium]